MYVLPPRFARPRCVVMALAALAVGGGAGTLRAELTWKEQTVEIDADAKATVLEARYHFTNSGDTPVDIQEIHTSCGCTTAELTQRHYAPGQSGEIVAHYTIDERIGVQHKSILVSTSDQPEATTLALVVRLPEFLHFEQAFVTWKQGEPTAAKTLPITVAPNTPRPEDLSVHCSNTSFTAAVQPASEGTGFELRVTPAATDKPAFATLVVRCRFGAAEKSFRAYATVKPSDSAETLTIPAVAKRPAVPPAAASPTPNG